MRLVGCSCYVTPLAAMRVRRAKTVSGVSRPSASQSGGMAGGPSDPRRTGFVTDIEDLDEINFKPIAIFITSVISTSPV